MNIAVCDDNIYMTAKMEEIIGSCFGNDENRFVCDVYLSGEELIDALEQEPLKYQIYVLDIEMKELDGLQTAARIRAADPNAVIIFATSHQELMPEAFDVVAFHFLVKPIDEDKARQVMLKAIAALEEKKTLFQFVIRKKIYTLYYGQIEYFESYGRKMIVHTIDGKEYEYYGTMKDVMSKVSHQSFSQVHNSYAINMDQIQTVDGEAVVLSSDMKIMITKKYHKDFHAAYRNFVLMRMG